MASMRLILVGLLVGGLITVAGCGDDDTKPSATSTGGAGGVGGVGGGTGTGGAMGGSGGAAPIQPGSEFDRFCRGAAWDEMLTEGAAGELTGEYLGALADPPPTGTLCTMKIIPEHPLYATTIRVAFSTGPGTARIRLMSTYGRSYPGGWDGWPTWETPEGNLLPPIEIEVPADPDPEEWIEIDIADAGIFLEPTQHYMLVYEHLGPDPRMAVEAIDSDPRGLLLIPGEAVPSGFADAQWRMELRGQFFCPWTEDERMFGEDTQVAFAADTSSTIGVADLNGDDHDDVVMYSGHPRAFFGDGTGSFVAPGFDPFPDTPRASFLVFGDLDNDGDRDAIATVNISPDADGDNFTVADGDCNNVDAAVNPGAIEVTNGYDDDCDGVADDGTDTSDGDMDGVDIASGDCDDTRDTVYPGAPELLDGRDNDCNLMVDEIFFNHVLLNDGSGLFTSVVNAGVEAQEPCASGALGDGDGDGYLDVYLGNWLRHYPQPQSVSDRYFTGNGDGTFVDALSASGLDLASPRATYGVRWNDFDNDGLADIWVGNYGYDPNLLWDNEGTGSFADVAAALGLQKDDTGAQGGNTFGGDFGDIDNDGDMDLYACNIAHPRYQPESDISRLLVSGGSPGFGFVDRREELGLVYDEGDINAAFADFDNDMDLDLIVGSTYPNHFSRLYRNDGASGFTDVTYETNTAVHEGAIVTWSDVDEDGDLDLLAAGKGEVHLFINRIGQDNGWVALDLEGTTTNRDAVGARVTVVAGGVTQMRDLADSGGNTNPQRTRIMHIGLGQSANVESVTVRWPGGSSETISGVQPNGRYKIVEGSGVAVPAN